MCVCVCVSSGGHGNAFQYSCLENPRDRGAWWATVDGVIESHTQLRRLSTHTHSYTYTVPFHCNICMDL